MVKLGNFNVPPYFLFLVVEDFAFLVWNLKSWSFFGGFKVGSFGIHGCFFGGWVICRLFVGFNIYSVELVSNVELGHDFGGY